MDLLPLFTIIGCERCNRGVERHERWRIVLRHQTETCQGDGFSESTITMSDMADTTSRSADLHLAGFSLAVYPIYTRLNCIVKGIKIWIIRPVAVLIREQLESAEAYLWDVDDVFAVNTL